MSMLKKTFAALTALGLGTGVTLAESARQGKAITEAEIAAWDLSILGDGT